MPASIGVNLRVTGHCRQGGRKYMEDFFSVAYQQTEDERDLEYAFFGIYDGHGGAEAAAFAKEHLMETIIKHRYFWSDNDEEVLRAIKDGYIATHYNMWKEQVKWPKTSSGLPSTAGTTASVAFIRRGKIYIGHVGDSGIILGYQEPGSSEWKAKPLTRDHKPENADEMSRIVSCGGKVVSKSGVPRVVWNRPRIGHQGPVRRSTPIDEIPFLAVARSLGDLWSYNSQNNQFIVSPDPDCSVISIDCNVHRCLIFGTDGLYNMLSPQMAVHIVQQAERHNEAAALSDNINKTWLNPSKLLVEKALERWRSTKMRADNTSVVTLMLDPPGPPRAQVLKNRKKNAYPDSGLKIMTRYEDEKQENNCVNCSPIAENPEERVSTPIPNLVAPPPCGNVIKNVRSDAKSKAQSDKSKLQDENETLSQAETPVVPSMTSESVPVTSSDITSNTFPLKEMNFVPRPRESTSFDPRETYPILEEKENLNGTSSVREDNTIQINEISSSSSDILDVGTEERTEGCKTNLRNRKRLSPPKKETKQKDIAKSEVDETKPEEGKIVSTTKRMRPQLPVENTPQVRKSTRIDSKSKMANVIKTLKARVPRAGFVKPTPVATRKKALISSVKLSLTQKILKSKKLLLKKHVVKKPLTKKKTQLLLDAVQIRKTVKTSMVSVKRLNLTRSPKKTNTAEDKLKRKAAAELKLQNQRRKVKVDVVEETKAARRPRRIHADNVTEVPPVKRRKVENEVSTSKPKVAVKRTSSQKKVKDSKAKSSSSREAVPRKASLRAVKKT